MQLAKRSLASTIFKFKPLLWLCICFYLPTTAFAEVLVSDDPEVDYAALNKLVNAAEDTNSDSLVVIHKGKVIGEWNFYQSRDLIDLMSTTKSVVSLAIGKLLTDGKLKSLDEPVWKYFPEWRQGEKEKITIRHLLNHTSGLQANRITKEIYRSPDFVKLALAAELSSKPGTKFFYNNKAVNLLPAIVEKVSGQKIDRYVETKIFSPLGIHSYKWERDKAGNNVGMAELFLSAYDLAKLGQLCLNKGKWKGKQIISEAYINEASTQAQPYEWCYGLLFWLDPEWQINTFVIDKAAVEACKEKGLRSELQEKLIGLIGPKLTFPQIKERLGTLSKEQTEILYEALSPCLKDEHGPILGFSARGYLGQLLLVYPQQELVISRLIKSSHHRSDNDDFEGISKLGRAVCNY